MERGVPVAWWLMCWTVTSKLVLLNFSHAAIHFQTNTLGKGINLLIAPSNELNSTISRMALVLNNTQRLICH